MTATKVTLLAEKYYSKLWMGEGVPAATFLDPSAKKKVYTGGEVETGYEAFTTTDAYVGTYIVWYCSGPRIGAFYEVTSENKDTLNIVPGTTRAYSTQVVSAEVDASSFSTTADYVGYFVLIPPTPTPTSLVEVTSDNKDNLEIIPGVTVAYSSAISMEEVPVEVTPKLGWFYVDATTGNFYIYTGGNTGNGWGSAIGKWTGGFL